MPTIMRIVVQLRALSGEPDDAVENIFHFAGGVDGDRVVDLGNVMDRLEPFYNFVNSSGGNPAQFLSTSITRAADGCRMLGYFSTDAVNPVEFGSPDLVRDFTLEAGGGVSNLPSEVAMVGSFRGNVTNVPETVGNTRPAARRRGRIFVGPLNNTAISEDPNTDVPRVNEDAMWALNTAMENLHTANDDLTWAVWSKLDETLYDVVAGHVDNAFDIQRRRGELATARVIWPD